jgi:serine/threonine protein kinase
MKARTGDGGGVFDAVQREASMLLRLGGHPAVLGLVGYTPPLAGAHAAFVYTELMEGGALADAVRGQTGARPTARAKWALGVALAMRFCHTRKIVHGALDPSNILLDAADEPCIAGFAAARTIGTFASFDGCPAALWYTAPELFEVGAECNVASDVYAYAVVLAEIVTATAPFAERATPEEFARGVRELGWRPSVAGVADWVAQLLAKMWDGRPTKRPSFGEIISAMADREYAILPEVDPAKVEEYLGRVLKEEAALMGPSG